MRMHWAAALCLATADRPHNSLLRPVGQWRQGPCCCAQPEIEQLIRTDAYKATDRLERHQPPAPLGHMASPSLACCWLDCICAHGSAAGNTSRLDYGVLDYGVLDLGSRRRR